jgi:hypothetical protein
LNQEHEVYDQYLGCWTQLRSGTEAGAIYGYDEQSREFRLRATHGMDQRLIEVLTQRHIDLADPTIVAIFADHEPTRVADLREEAVSELNGIILLAGYRALVRDDLEFDSSQNLKSGNVRYGPDSKHVPPLYTIAECNWRVTPAQCQNLKLSRVVVLKL